jgi:hypothetical protein
MVHASGWGRCGAVGSGTFEAGAGLGPAGSLVATGFTQQCRRAAVVIQWKSGQNPGLSPTAALQHVLPMKTLLPERLDAAQGLRAIRSHRIAQQSRQSGTARMPGVHHHWAARAF